jgi:hypothetical protein
MPLTSKDGLSLTPIDDKTDYKEYTKESFSTTLTQDGVYVSVHKPDIDKTKLLTQEESEQVKTSLWNEGLVDEKEKKVFAGRKLIFKELLPAKNDYKHDFDRGTVHYTPKNRNYSFHKVIIPDDTVVRDSNFSQRVADTEAISGKNLTFIDCNLVNVKVDASWTLQCCNNCQIKRELASQQNLGDGTTKLVISHKVRDKKTNEFVEVAVNEETIGNDKLQNQLIYFGGE